MSTVTEVTLEAPDISCDHCISSIQKAVTKLPGVTFLSGDPDSKLVVVAYDPSSVALEAIEQAMEEEGYPVKK
jgi:copper chaperone CopZ